VGVAYTQTIDAEGRAVTIRNSDTGETWTSTYDGDSGRIRQVNPDGTSTLFLAGGLYEVTLSSGGQQTAVERYYAIGCSPARGNWPRPASQISMRVGSIPRSAGSPRPTRSSPTRSARSR
jgi:YD repeat-containing protein